MVWPGFRIEPLRGKTSLAKVFWLYCFGSSVMYKVLGWLAGPQSQVAVVVYLLGGVALAVLQFAMLWRCAYNTRYRSLGTVIRTCVVAAVLTMPFLLYDILTNPRALIAS